MTSSRSPHCHGTCSLPSLSWACCVRTSSTGFEPRLQDVRRLHGGDGCHREPINRPIVAVPSGFRTCPGHRVCGHLARRSTVPSLGCLRVGGVRGVPGGDCLYKARGVAGPDHVGAGSRDVPLRNPRPVDGPRLDLRPPGHRLPQRFGSGSGPAINASIRSRRKRSLRCLGGSSAFRRGIAVWSTTAVVVLPSFNLRPHLDAARSTRKFRIFCFVHCWIFLAVTVVVSRAIVPRLRPAGPASPLPHREGLREVGRVPQEDRVGPGDVGYAGDLGRWAPGRDRGGLGLLLRHRCHRDLPEHLVLFGSMRPDAVLTPAPEEREPGRRHSSGGYASQR